MRISTIIRKVVAGIGGVTNWLAYATPGVSIGMRLIGLIGDARPAGSVTFAPATMKADEKPAPNVTFAPASFLTPEMAAINATAVARLLAPEMPALLTDAGIATLKVDEKPAPNVTFAPGSFIPIPELVAPKVSLSPATLLAAETPAPSVVIGAATMKADEKPAGKVVRVQVDLTHFNYIQAGTATQDVGGSWVTPAQAEGVSDTTDGTPPTNVAHLDEGIILTIGTLRGSHAAQLNRPSTLIIDRVDLAFKTKGYGITVGVLSSLTLGFRINLSPIPGTDTNMSAPLTVHNNLATGLSFRIDDGAGAFLDLAATPVTWANVSLVQPFCNGRILVDAGLAHFDVAEVKLTVTAHETWTP